MFLEMKIGVKKSKNDQQDNFCICTAMGTFLCVIDFFNWQMEPITETLDISYCYFSTVLIFSCSSSFHSVNLTWFWEKVQFFTGLSSSGWSWPLISLCVGPAFVCPHYNRTPAMKTYSLKRFKKGGRQLTNVYTYTKHHTRGQNHCHCHCWP